MARVILIDDVPVLFEGDTLSLDGIALVTEIAQTLALSTKIDTDDIINNLTTNDATKPISAAQAFALKQMIDTQSLGLVPKGNWDASGSIPTGNVGDFFVVDVPGTTEWGGISDWAVNDWVVITAGGVLKIDNTDKVLSVDGHVGHVTLTMMGLNNVDNTADADKPVSTAQQDALNTKADIVDWVRKRVTVDLTIIGANTLYTVPAGTIFVIKDATIVIHESGPNPVAPEMEIVTNEPANITPQEYLTDGSLYGVNAYDVDGFRALIAGTVLSCNVVSPGSVDSGNYMATGLISGYLISI